MTARAPVLAWALAGVGAVLGARGAWAAPPPAAPDPDAPTVAARVEPAPAYIGDELPLVVTAIAKSGIQVNLPARLELGPFQVIDTKERTAPTGDGRVEYEFTLTVAAYDVGELHVPPIAITYLTPSGDTRTVETQPVAVRIRSLLANETNPQLKGGLGPRPVFQRNWTLVILAGVLLGAGAVAGATWWIAAALRRRAVLGKPPPPPRPAYDVAMEKLAALVAAGDVARDGYKPFYFSLSEILRGYLGGRYGFDALELTTTELCDELARLSTPADPSTAWPHIPAIQGWLGSIDLVKFAKYTPADPEAQACLDQARRLLEATRPREPSPAASAPAGPTSTPPAPAPAAAEKAASDA